MAATGLANLPALSHKSILTMPSQAPHWRQRPIPAQSYKYDSTVSHRQGINLQLIGSFNPRRKIVSICRYHEDRIGQDKTGREIKREEDNFQDPGVEVALALLKFYRREISPLLPSSCRYVPSCSEYSMQAYKRYGVVKGTVLTAWRLCRCNPLGGSGFDPPRWFGEDKPPSP